MDTPKLNWTLKGFHPSELGPKGCYREILILKSDKSHSFYRSF